MLNLIDSWVNFHCHFTQFFLQEILLMIYYYRTPDEIFSKQFQQTACSHKPSLTSGELIVTI